MTDLEPGDRVEFREAHHAMNSSLKSLVGETGTVKTVPDKDSYNDKVLVKFDVSRTKKVIEQWHINPNWLEEIQ